MARPSVIGWQLAGSALVLFFVGMLLFRMAAGHRGVSSGDYGWDGLLGALQLSSLGFLATAWVGARLLRPLEGPRWKVAAVAGGLAGVAWGVLTGFGTQLGMDLCVFLCSTPDPSFPLKAGLLHGSVLLLACLVASWRADSAKTPRRAFGDFVATGLALALVLQPTQSWPYEMLPRSLVDRLEDAIVAFLRLLPTMAALATMAAVMLRPAGPKAFPRSLAWGSAVAGAWALAFLALRGRLEPGAVDRFFWLNVLEGVLLLAAFGAGGLLVARQAPKEPVAATT